MAITPAHRQYLNAAAITDAVLDASGIQSSPSGDAIRFPWSDGVCAPVWQTRPDKPKADEDGRPMKYVFRKGANIPLNRLRHMADHTSALLVEGTKQQYAALSHAPADFDVWGMAGAWNFQHTDMSVFTGRDVFVALDADFRTNPDVYAAAEALAEQLKLGGATSVRWVVTPGSGKEGLDDVLANVTGDRTQALKRWLAVSLDKLPKRPKAKKPTLDDADSEAAKLFRQRDKPLAFQPVDAAMKIMETTPAAVTAEKNIALYANGVYRVDEDAILSVVVKLLGNFYTPGFRAQATDVLRGLLSAEGKRLPERMAKPLLNCPNGMVDLRTGTLLPHDPSHMSYVQVTTDYRPELATPTYDAWLREALRQEGATDADVEALIADLEETAGTMLDPSKTPSKALFLFGPSRSGKSTFLRLLKAIAGAANTSAVTLHDLGKDQFATANLYGRMLNVAADLSNEHVADLSKFKMATGEDVLHANRKYGQQFEFTNQALFAFSANELPTVSEASRAYAERMKPFEFPNSFAGREDKTLEDKLMAELPGILARWVTAYGRFLARGGYGRTDVRTQLAFEAKSDRVVQFFQDMVTVTDAEHGARLTDDTATGRRDVAMAFNAWAERNGGSKMGERAFFNRFQQMAGVVEVRVGKGSRAYNVTVAKADDDSWAEDAQPVADPIAPSAPQAAADAAASACQVPSATAAVNGAQTAADSFATPDDRVAAILTDYADDPWTAAKLIDQLND